MFDFWWIYVVGKCQIRCWTHKLFRKKGWQRSPNWKDNEVYTQGKKVLCKLLNTFLIQNLEKIYAKRKTVALCLKITENVSFNIASEASYVYKFIKNAKNGPFWRVFENL